MKIVVIVAFTAICVFGARAQAPKSVPLNASAARTEFMNAKYWSKIGGQDDKDLGFTLFSRNLLPNPEGQIELWVKIVPLNTEKFNRHYSISSESSFVLQYATVDCAKNVLLLERTGVYDSTFRKLGEGTSALNPKSIKDRVKPGSIGAEIFQGVCVKLAV